MRRRTAGKGMSHSTPSTHTYTATLHASGAVPRYYCSPPGSQHCYQLPSLLMWTLLQLEQCCLDLCRAKIKFFAYNLQPDRHTYALPDHPEIIWRSALPSSHGAARQAHSGARTAVQIGTSGPPARGALPTEIDAAKSDALWIYLLIRVHCPEQTARSGHSR
jgi:hypothetical protein